MINKATRIALIAVTFSVLASCSSHSVLKTTTDRIKGIVKYPDSRYIYNVCHERWLRNGYQNYRFLAESGAYDSAREIQRGTLTTVTVKNNELEQVSACELVYSGRSASCRPNTNRQLQAGNTINDYFTLWKANPGLYQGCHPVLGYPTGYGATYGDRGRRIDAARWLILSGFQPLSAGARTAPAQSTLTHSNSGKTASMRNMPVKLHSSYVSQQGNRHLLNSVFEIVNPTSQPARVAIRGWMLDSAYQRYPLFVISTGKGEQQVYNHTIPAHTSSRIEYTAEGAPGVQPGRRTAALIELTSPDGVSVNLSLPNQ